MKIEEGKKLKSCNDLEVKVVKNEYRLSNKGSNVNFNSLLVSVLPRDVDWCKMEGFIDEKYGPFNYIFKNTKDEIVAKLDFWFNCSCKGTYNSRGRFLVDATVCPKLAFAAPGYFLDCNLTGGNPKNYGTVEDPIPGIILKLQVRLKSYYKFDYVKYVFSKENCKKPKDFSDLNKEFIISCSSSNNYNCINVIEFYAIVSVRGDGQWSIISVEGY